jgi:hypothetical protein
VAKDIVAASGADALLEGADGERFIAGRTMSWRECVDLSKAGIHYLSGLPRSRPCGHGGTLRQDEKPCSLCGLLALKTGDDCPPADAASSNTSRAPFCVFSLPHFFLSVLTHSPPFTFHMHSNNFTFLTLAGEWLRELLHRGFIAHSCITATCLKRWLSSWSLRCKQNGGAHALKHLDCPPVTLPLGRSLEARPAARLDITSP